MILMNENDEKVGVITITTPKLSSRMTYWDEELGSYFPTKEYREEFNGIGWDTINRIGELENRE